MTQNTTLSQEHQKEWMDFCEKLCKLNLTKDMTPGLNFIYEQLEDSVILQKNLLVCNSKIFIVRLRVLAKFNV